MKIKAEINEIRTKIQSPVLDDSQEHNVDYLKKQVAE